MTKLPGFWAELAVIILPQHFTYICDDLQCAARTAVPSCDTCVLRINGVTDALGWEETVNFCFCMLSFLRWCFYTN